MSQLKTLQSSFQNYILKQEVEMRKSVVSTEKVSAKQRLDIYKNAYHLRLQEVLEKDFPITRQLIGEKEFKTIVLDYIFHHPSESFSLLSFGETFPLYIKRLEPLISEVSCLERFVDEVLDEQDSKTLSMSELQAVAQSNLAAHVFMLCSALRWQVFGSNAFELWQARYNGRELPTLRAVEQHAILIWRKELRPCFRRISDEEINLLNFLNKSLSFERICELLSEVMPEEEVAPFAVGRLQQWVSDGLLRGLN